MRNIKKNMSIKQEEDVTYMHAQRKKKERITNKNMNGIKIANPFIAFPG